MPKIPLDPVKLKSTGTSSRKLLVTENSNAGKETITVSDILSDAVPNKTVAITGVCVSVSVASATRKPTLTERNEQATAKLAERFDALNQAISVAEQRLKKLKPARPVWVFYNRVSAGEGDQPPFSYDVLGICKVGGQWRLVHANDDDCNYGGEPWGIQPLTDCPVELRVCAVKELAALHAKIVESKEQFIPEVEQAISAVLDYCKGGQS